MITYDEDSGLDDYARKISLATSADDAANGTTIQMTNTLTDAEIDAVVITAGDDVIVDATDESAVYTISASLSGSNSASSVAGAIAYLGDSTRAYVSDTDVNSAEDTGGDVVVYAAHQNTVEQFVGAAGLGVLGVDTVVEAYVADTSTNPSTWDTLYAGGDLLVDAELDQDITHDAVGAVLTTDVTLVGSELGTRLNTAVAAHVTCMTAYVDGNTTVRADDDTFVDNSVGSAAVGKKAGGGAISVFIDTSTVKAEIIGAQVNTVGKTNVWANRDLELYVTTLCGAITGEGSYFFSVAINYADASVVARIRDDDYRNAGINQDVASPGSTQDVNVAASETFTILEIVGAAALSGGSDGIGGIGGGVGVWIIENTVKAYIGDNVEVQGGSISLVGVIYNTGGGQLKVMDGYGDISVDNQSDIDLAILGNLSAGKGSDDEDGIAGKITLIDGSQTTVITRVGSTVEVAGNTDRVTTFDATPGDSADTDVVHATYTPYERYYCWRESNYEDERYFYDFNDNDGPYNSSDVTESFISDLLEDETGRLKFRTDYPVSLTDELIIPASRLDDYFDDMENEATGTFYQYGFEIEQKSYSRHTEWGNEYDWIGSYETTNFESAIDYTWYESHWHFVRGDDPIGSPIWTPSTNVTGLYAKATPPSTDRASSPISPSPTPMTSGRASKRTGTTATRSPSSKPRSRKSSTSWTTSSAWAGAT